MDRLTARQDRKLLAGHRPGGAGEARRWLLDTLGARAAGPARLQRGAQSRGTRPATALALTGRGRPGSFAVADGPAVAPPGGAAAWGGLVIVRARAARVLAVVAVALGPAASAACSAPPSAVHGAGAARGGFRYWTPDRFLDASPFFGSGGHVPAPGESATAEPALFAVRVGALFFQDRSGGHFCTASVVTSPGKNLLITAAHCINAGSGGGYRQNIVFVPGYRNGAAPFGVWTVRRLLVAPQWAKSSDPALDVGFVVLNPRNGVDIEDFLGANRLGVDSGYQYLVRVTGYPESDEAPITCRNWTSRQSATQLRFVCGGFTAGTSGSPWVTRFDRRTRTGTIVGVIGGYQQGGATAAVSYSPVLGPAVLRLYRQALVTPVPPGTH